MQLYVLDRAKNTLATTSSFYSDKHHKELTAGASIFEFTIDKSDSAAQYMTTGNYLVFQDDRGRAWSFTILSYDETQTTKTVAAEDVSIELLNKAMDVWNTDQAYPFSYYFDLVTKGTPWTLGVNQLTDLSRKLVYTGRDTGLGRLLSVLKGFDNAECQFNIKVKQNSPIEFTVDVYKSIGTVQDNIQIVYNNELNDIKKTESRAQFVTALAGVGGLVENQATTDPGLEKHIDFTDIDYKDDNFVSPKGDKFLRAVTANRTFNPGTTTYIEDFYDYDTQSSQELLNRTLTQLKERSEPQYTYNADVKVIDPTLDIGDTVTIIDHDYNPALYLQARVATLDKSYTDPTQGAITFCNYRVLNSNLSDQLRAMQNIIDQLPTSASIKVINNNIVQMITQNEELKKQVALSFESANGKSRVWFSRSSTAQNGDVAFIKNADGATEIWKFVEGAWKLDTGLATFDDVKKAASAAADAGSQAVTAGQQASAAGSQAAVVGLQASTAGSQAISAGNQASLADSQAAIAGSQAVTAGSQASSAGSQAVVAGLQASAAGSQAISAGSQASWAGSQAAVAGKQASAAGSQAVIAGQQASTAGSQAISAGSQASWAGSQAAVAGKQASTAGSQAVTAGQQASAAGADAKSAGDFAASAASQSTIETSAARSTANSAVDQANLAVSQAGFANNAADQAKSAAASAQSDAAGALGKASTAITNASTAINAATDAQTKTNSLVTKVDDIAGTIKTLATTETVDQLAGTVATTQSLAQFAADGLKLKADTTTVDKINGTVNDLKGELDVQADKIAATVTASDVTGMLGNYATQSWSQGQISAAKNEISASVETVQTQVKNSAVGTNLLTGTSSSEQSYMNDFSTVPGWIYSNFLQGSQPAVNVGSTYTYSIYLTKLTGSFALGYWGYDSNKKYARWFPSPIYSSLGKVSWTFTIPSGISYIVPHVVHASDDFTCTAKEEKLEKGSVATDWCLAPEDQATVDWTKSQLDIKDGKISAAVTSLKSDITNATAGMATQTWTQGRLDLTAEGFTSQISSVQTNLDNMQIGGRNYILNSGQPITINGDTDHFKILYYNLTPGTWTFSANAKYTRGTDTSVFLAIYSADTAIGYNNASVPIVNGKIAWTFKPNNPAGVLLLMYAGSGSWGTTPGKTLEVSHRKLEKGNKSTDWSPAPEDQATVADVSSQFTQLQNDINLRVKTGDLVSQIDVNAKRILLDGASTYITNTTHIDTGVIKTAMIADAAITNGKIANAAIDNAKIADASIDNAKIADLAVSTAQIADGAITNAKIGNASITTAKIGDAQINSAKIGALAVNTAQIANGAITTAKIGSLAVGTAQIADGAINSAKIASLAVGTAQIADGAISNAKIGKAAIFSAQIAELAVGTAQIADAAITNGKIANASIDNAKIANAAITAAKIADLAVGSAQIADGAISSAKIGNAAITSAQIADASIIDAKIVNLDGSKIVANSITADKLDVNAIEVGLNTYGIGWQITPASIKFLPSASSTKASLILTGEGIILGDTTTGEMLGEITGSPFDLTKDTWFNGFNLLLKYNGGDFVHLGREKADGTMSSKMIWSNADESSFGIYSGFNFYDHVHFNTIGPFDPDDNAQMHVVRTQIDGHWCTGFMAHDGLAGVAFGDGGWLYLERDNKWIDFWNIVNKIGLA
jgi:hypothetical protein